MGCEWPRPNLGEDRRPNRHGISRIQSGPQVLVKKHINMWHADLNIIKLIKN